MFSCSPREVNFKKLLVRTCSSLEFSGRFKDDDFCSARRLLPFAGYGLHHLFPLHFLSHSQRREGPRPVDRCRPVLSNRRRAALTGRASQKETCDPMATAGCGCTTAVQYSSLGDICELKKNERWNLFWNRLFWSALDWLLTCLVAWKVCILLWTNLLGLAFLMILFISRQPAGDWGSGSFDESRKRLVGCWDVKHP